MKKFVYSKDELLRIKSAPLAQHPLKQSNDEGIHAEDLERGLLGGQARRNRFERPDNFEWSRGRRGTRDKETFEEGYLYELEQSEKHKKELEHTIKDEQDRRETQQQVPEAQSTSQSKPAVETSEKEQGDDGQEPLNEIDAAFGEIDLTKGGLWGVETKKASRFKFPAAATLPSPPPASVPPQPSQSHSTSQGPQSQQTQPSKKKDQLLSVAVSTPAATETPKGPAVVHEPATTAPPLQGEVQPRGRGS